MLIRIIFLFFQKRLNIFYLFNINFVYFKVFFDRVYYDILRCGLLGGGEGGYINYF